jgi:hypothetical protein
MKLSAATAGLPWASATRPCIAASSGVAAQRSVGLEEQVAFDRETEHTTDGCNFREPDISEFGVADTKVTEAKGKVGINRIELGEEPTGIRREELQDEIRVDLLAARSASAIGEQFGAQFVGDEGMGHDCLRCDHPPVEGGLAKSRGNEAVA